jgi:hypothetical protein
MIIDKTLTFQEDTALAADTTETAATNILFNGANGDDINRLLTLVILITESVDSAADNCTVNFKLYTGATTATATELFATGAKAQAALTAGTMLKYPLPPGLDNYLKLTSTVGVANATAGKYTAFISSGVDLP